MHMTPFQTLEISVYLKKPWIRDRFTPKTSISRNSFNAKAISRIPERFSGKYCSSWNLARTRSHCCSCWTLSAPEAKRFSSSIWVDNLHKIFGICVEVSVLYEHTLWLKGAYKPPVPHPFFVIWSFSQQTFLILNWGAGGGGTQEFHPSEGKRSGQRDLCVCFRRSIGLLKKGSGPNIVIHLADL